MPTPEEFNMANEGFKTYVFDNYYWPEDDVTPTIISDLADDLGVVFNEMRLAGANGDIPYIKAPILVGIPTTPGQLLLMVIWKLAMSATGNIKVTALPRDPHQVALIKRDKTLVAIPSHLPLMCLEPKQTYNGRLRVRNGRANQKKWLCPLEHPEDPRRLTWVPLSQVLQTGESKLSDILKRVDWPIGGWGPRGPLIHLVFNMDNLRCRKSDKLPIEEVVIYRRYDNREEDEEEEEEEEGLVPESEVEELKRAKRAAQNISKTYSRRRPPFVNPEFPPVGTPSQPPVDAGDDQHRDGMDLDDEPILDEYPASRFSSPATPPRIRDRDASPRRSPSQGPTNEQFLELQRTVHDEIRRNEAREQRNEERHVAMTEVITATMAAMNVQTGAIRQLAERMGAVLPEVARSTSQSPRHRSNSRSRRSDAESRRHRSHRQSSRH